MHTHPLALPALILLLVGGCASGGGGSGGGSSAPTPMAPRPGATTITSSTIEKLAPLSARPGLIGGTYALKAVTFELTNGITSSQKLDHGAASLVIDAATKTYTLSIDVAGYPDGERFDLEHPGANVATGFGYRVRETRHLSDGSTKVTEYDNDQGDCCYPDWVKTADGKVQETVFQFDVRPQYVSLGSWSRRIGDAVPGTNGWTFANDGPHKQVDFVMGTRTEAGDVPLSGNAVYDAGPLTLSADFGARSIAAEIEVAPYYDGDGGCCVIGISARGQASITGDGDFLIPLSGQFFEPHGTPDGALTGSVDGAFFGPQAAEVGGVYQLYRDGAAWSAAAFAGTQGR